MTDNLGLDRARPMTVELARRAPSPILIRIVSGRALGQQPCRRRGKTCPWLRITCFTEVVYILHISPPVDFPN